jgi:hypothetical protein
LNRDWLAARAAPTAEQEIAEHGDVVGELQLGPAVGTPGCRRDDGLAKGKPVNADVKETPYDQAERERQYRSL